MDRDTRVRVSAGFHLTSLVSVVVSAPQGRRSERGEFSAVADGTDAARDTSLQGTYMQESPPPPPSRSTRFEERSCVTLPFAVDRNIPPKL